MLQRTISMYPNTPDMVEFRKAIYENNNEGFPFGNGSDDQLRLTEFNSHWYSYTHKNYQAWELTFRSLMGYRGDNVCADYSMMGSFEDLSRFFWTGMLKDDRDNFLKKVYFGDYYKSVEALEE